MLLMPDSTLDLLVGFFFPFSLKHVQFLEEELSLSHLHMLSHICFCPGGFPADFSLQTSSSSGLQLPVLPVLTAVAVQCLHVGALPGVMKAWLPPCSLV